jgi:diguanylate cyclase (GGDEF)-like protein/PAS domain S-box-containing protein
LINRRTTAAAEAIAPAPRSGADDGPGRGARSEVPLVLVVDDDAGVRLMVDSTLSAAGFRVLEAADGERGLEAFRTMRPDIVLCDVVMPGMDGFELCSLLKASAERAHVPVVMLTALDDTGSVDDAYSRGASDFIVKPITWPLLPHRVRYVLRASGALRALSQSEERFALAAHGANDGLWDWDLVTNRVYYSPRWKAMLGLTERDVDECLGAWLERIHPEDATRVRADLDTHLAGETSHFESEHRVRTGDRGYLWVVVRGLAVRRPNGEPYRIAGSQTDVSKRKEVEAKLLHDAFHDALTGLPNRTLFLDRLAHCIDLARRRHSYRFAVLFVDLDRFKVINDSLGHIRGDRFLVEIADRLHRTLRQGDTLARLGGDEFTFLIEDIDDVADATRMAERIQSDLQRPLDLEEQQVVTSASIGIAFSAPGYRRPEDMLRDADAAMYRAKAAGRGCSEIFDAQMHAQAVQTLELESELRRALVHREFEVYYQPITCLRSGEVQGFEALVRWRHPRRGLLLPEIFLAVAEDTQLIVPIGRFVLREACAQLVKWQRTRSEASGWYVAVNLSSRELAQPDVLAAVSETLAESGLAPASLKLEMTEGSLIENDAQALELMTALRAMGVQLSIDDFGTGYSSLNYLHRFPFDVLKIDRSFISDLDTNPQGFEIVREVIELAHNLGLRVVAEGTQTREVLDRLQCLPCEYAQGFTILEPSSADVVEQYLDTHADGAGS